MDKSGTVYVADFIFDRIRKIEGGTTTTFAGAGLGFNGDGLWPLYTTFDDPVAVAVDSEGAAYELTTRTTAFGKSSRKGAPSKLTAGGI